jgi:hypothetical protein
MFKKITNLTEISKDREIWAEIKGQDAVQVMHRGNEPKVVISQDYFFHLLAAARIAFPGDEAASPAPSREVMLDRMRGVSRKVQSQLDSDTDGKDR